MVFVLMMLFAILSATIATDSKFIENQALSKIDSKRGDARITNGVLAREGEIPYQGFLLIRTSVTSVTLCGCVLIANRWVITTARCTNGISVDKLQVTFGTIDRVESPLFDSETRAVTANFIHPDYEETSTGPLNDISLLQLSSAISSTKYIKPICLPNDESVFKEVNQNSCEISGWGTTSGGVLSPSRYLRKATVPIVNDSLCSDWYNQSSSHDFSNQYVCAGYENGGQSFCHGDQGGSLACPCTDNSGRVLVGIASHSEGCGEPQRPGVYTRIPFYKTWIENTLNLQGTTLTDFGCGANQIKRSVVLMIISCLLFFKSVLF